MKIYVLWWKYSDGSDIKVERAYSDKIRAEEDLKLLDIALSSKDWQITELDLMTNAKSI